MQKFLAVTGRRAIEAVAGLSLLSGLLPAALAQLPENQLVTDQQLASPADEDWLMWRRTLNSWGYSPLDQISRDNVDQLQLVWDRPLHEGLQEGTPLIHNGVLYMPNPRDIVQAIDAETGDLLWEYDRQLPDDIGDYIGFHETNRALAIYGDVIVYTTNDDYIVGLDARTGDLRYETQIFDYQTQPVQQSSGPIIVKGLAVSGRTCPPESGPDACVITAHNALTGEEVWRLNTIQKPGEGEDTWGVPWEQRWHVGAWMMPSYDPELDLIYMGTSVTAPAPKFLIDGNDKQYLYHNSTLAIRPDDGSIAWYYQHLVDHWDLDYPFERLLVDTEVAPVADEVEWISPDIEPGRTYKVLTGIPGKTGVVYTLDRETGKFLWARSTVFQNVVGEIDGSSGEVTVNPAALFHETGESVEICPSAMGGKNWQAGAYSPLSNAMYYSLQQTCSVITATGSEMNVDESYAIFGREMMAPGESDVGAVFAVSAETGRLLWKQTMPSSSLSLLTTGGGLVVGGDAYGNLRAYDQDSGEVLWHENLGATVSGYPVSFGFGGRQYLAVGTGSSVTTSNQQGLFDQALNQENHLYIFALPQQ